MTFDMDILHAGSLLHYLGQVNSSRSWEETTKTLT